MLNTNIIGSEQRQIGDGYIKHLFYQKTFGVFIRKFPQNIKDTLSSVNLMLYPKISVLLIGSTYDLLQYSQAFKKTQKTGI